MCQWVFIVKRKKGNGVKSRRNRECACAWCVFARNKVSISGKVNDWNCSCVNYFLQLNLIQIAKRGKWKVSDESDNKV